MPLINKILLKFKGETKIVSQDWHPEDHCSFKPQGGQWPVHCVAGTKGAELHSELDSKLFTVIIKKATAKEKDAYSAFDGTGLEGLLKALGVKEVFVCGLATDFCVQATALDSVKSFETVVIQDACKAVTAEGDRQALLKMENAGIKLIMSKEVI